MGTQSNNHTPKLMSDAATNGDRPPRPNIVLILIDDLGWRDLSSYGSSFYETPNIDQLAAAGMTFTNAYAASPVCSPTRASLLTGRYPASVGITNFIAEGEDLHPDRGQVIDAPYHRELPASAQTIAEALNAGGYTTWHVGKWHLGGGTSLPQHRGFETNIGGSQAGWPGSGGYFSPWSIDGLDDVDVPDGVYLTDWLTDRAIDLLTDRDHDAPPFFLNLWYYAVHTPIEAKADKIAKYERKAKEMGLDQIPAFEEGPQFPTDAKRSERIVRRVVQSDPVYAAMVETLDDNIGRLIEAMEASEQAEDTLVLFTSDNGGLATAEGSPTTNLPLAEGKGWMYEGGTREPMIAYWPGHIEPGSYCHTPITSPDLFPTLAELADIDRPGPDVDGVSFAPLLHDAEATIERDAIFWHFPHYGNQGGTPAASVRVGDHKLIEFFEDGRIELYDLREDVGERENLAEAQPELAAELHQRLIEWRLSVGAELPSPNPDYAAQPRL